jgi:Tol biopolymer transport system component
MEESESGQLRTEIGVVPRRRAPRWVWALAAAVILVAAAGIWWLLSPKASPTSPVLTRLTSSAGFDTDPALSPDGKLIAYASDREGNGNLDIWVHPVAGGRAARLTRHEADDREPAFSNDGGTIVFRSERDGGGIYSVSILGGGDERLLAREGRRPRFSPDGTQIAYTVGQPGAGKIYVMPAAGGQPKQLFGDFDAAAYPVWSPDGKQLLFLGNRGQGVIDWWAGSLDGTVPVKTEAYAALRSQQISGSGVPPGAWIPEGNRIIFSVLLGDSRNLWEASLDASSWQITNPKRLTSGAGQEVQPAAAGSRLVFSSLNENTDLWSLPIDGNTGRVTGTIERLTEDTGVDIWPSLSADGGKLTYISIRSGKADIWVKDLTSGKTLALTNSPENESYPKISPDGSKVAYSIFGQGQTYVIPTGLAGSSGPPENLSQEYAPMGWSPDGKALVVQENHFQSFGILRLGSFEVEDRVSSTGSTSARISPDNRWVASARGVAPGKGQVVVRPFRSTTASTQPIPVTDGDSFDTAPAWSPDGNLLYFLSDRDGFRCLWAQPLKRETKDPSGPVFSVYHFHGAGLTSMDMQAAQLQLDVGPRRIVFSLGQRTGNIWMAEWKRGRK